MVRSSANRVSKYDAKMVGDVVKNRIDAQRDSMVAQETTVFGDLVNIEEAVKTLLEGWGVSVVVIPSYLAFARECYRINKTHAGSIGVDEMCYSAAHWASRGLLIYYLQQIAFTATGVDISSCT
jgi:hypothetical protein